jgi:predicted RNA-binding Zn ribbon-like protein
MTVRDGFLFLGGHPAIDFLNTEIVADGAPLDLLGDPSALARWFTAAEIRDVPVTARTLAAVKRLRTELREAVLRRAEGHSLKKSTIEALNEALRRGKGALRLRPDGGELELVFEVEEPEALFVLARAAAEFFTMADTRRIGRCQGTNCILLFYDVTKSGTRRWCSMAGCGNRMKAALHYARRHEPQE